MNSVSDLSTIVTGKAEAGLTVKLSINNKYQNQQQRQQSVSTYLPFRSKKAEQQLL
ncbi:hypothetical protein QNK12_14165 [Neobacillus cucumis]|nr:hypothetical protein QNK12_14165 [Neobacillus cucumis]